MLHVQQRVAQKEISDYVLRLHVRANSDTDKDQTEKLKVRDAFLTELWQYQGEMTDKAAVENVLSEHGQTILEAVEKNTAGGDNTSDLHMYLGTEWFPKKTYGDITLPEGRYDAVIVDIGSGKGQNWWCVVFPKLCFVSPVTGYIPEEEKESFESAMDESTWEMIEAPEVEVKFKIVELLGQLMKR